MRSSDGDARFGLAGTQAVGSRASWSPGHSARQGACAERPWWTGPKRFLGLGPVNGSHLHPKVERRQAGLVGLLVLTGQSFGA